VKINVSLPYMVREVDRKPESYFNSDRQITDFLIRQAITDRYKAGVKEKAVRRQIAPIYKILGAVVNEKMNDVEFTLEQITFILDSFEAWEAPTFVLSWLDDFSEYLAEQKKTAEKATKELAGSKA